MSVRLRNRTATLLVFAVLALAAALALQSPQPGVAAEGPAGIEVSASVDSCSKSGCQLSVRFGVLNAARSYEVTISGPDGAVLTSVPAEPGGGTYAVPYAGDGTYGVRVTAYGSN